MPVNADGQTDHDSVLPQMHREPPAEDPLHPRRRNFWEILYPRQISATHISNVTRRWIRDVAPSRRWVERLTSWTRAWTSRVSPQTDIEDEVRKEIVYAQAAAWMLEVAVEGEDLSLIAENIPSITSVEALRYISRNSSFSKLIVQFRAYLLPLYTAGTERVVLIYGRALCHLLAADPLHCYQAVYAEVCDISFDETDPPELKVLISSMVRLGSRLQKAPRDRRYVTNYTSMHEMEGLNKLRHQLDMATARIIPTLLTLSGPSLSNDEAVVAFCVDTLPPSNSILAIVSNMLRSSLQVNTMPSMDELVKQLWEVRKLYVIPIRACSVLS